MNNTSKWLYVIHEIDNSVVEFAIGTDGKLYQQHTYNTPGTYPIAVAIDPQSKFLFVVDSFASAFNNSGAVAPNDQSPSRPTQPRMAALSSILSLPRMAAWERP